MLPPTPGRPSAPPTALVHTHARTERSPLPRPYVRSPSVAVLVANAVQSSEFLSPAQQEALVAALLKSGSGTAAAAAARHAQQQRQQAAQQATQQAAAAGT